MSIQMLETLSEAGIYIFVFLCGAVIGSFLNVCILRLPRGESLVVNNSHCMTCGVPIKRYDLIPILSWIILGGKCRNCKAPISPRYMIVEALTAVLFVTTFAVFDVINFGFLYPALLCIFIAALIVLCFEDLDTKTMSLSVLIFAGLVAAGVTIFTAVSGKGDYIESVTGISLKSRLIGMCIVSLPLLIIGFVVTPLFYKAFLSEDHDERRKLRKRLRGGLSPYDEKKVKAALEKIESRITERGNVFGFGMGDVVLMAAAGLMLGVKAVVVAAFIAIVIGAVYGIIIKRKAMNETAAAGASETSATPDSAALETSAPPETTAASETTADSDATAVHDIAAADTTAAPETSAHEAAAAPDTTAPTASPAPPEDNSPGFAFGPFLCVGSVVAMFVGNRIADLYLSLLA